MRERILRFLLAPEVTGSIIRSMPMARERCLLSLSRLVFSLSHRLLFAGARAYWAGLIGRIGLRRILWISSRLDRAGMRLMRRSISQRRAKRQIDR